MPAAETEFLAGHLFAGDEGRQMVRRIDRRIDRLPGLAGLHLLEGAVERHSPRRPKPGSGEPITTPILRAEVAVAA